MAGKSIDREKYSGISENSPIYPGHNIPEWGTWFNSKLNDNNVFLHFKFTKYIYLYILFNNKSCS